MRHLLRPTLLSSLLVLVVVLSCHDRVTLPPVEGPPMTIPEHRGPSAAELSKRPLEITYAGPRGQLSSPHAQIAVSFSKPMVALTKVEDRAAKSYLSVEPEVAGKQRWLGSRTLVFEPDEPLPGSTTFTLKVPDGIKSVDGTRLEQGETWSFSTPRLRVSRMIPRPNSRWVTPDAAVSLFFNQPVSPAELSRHAAFRVVGDGGKGQRLSLTARVKRGKNDKHMVLRPSTEFPKNAHITLELAPELSGKQGPLSMGKPYASSFRTYGPLRVLSLSCTTGCDPDSSISVRFSNPVPMQHARRAIRINGRPIGGGSTNYHTATIYLGGRRKARTRYTVTVAPGLKDRFGQKLEAPTGPLAFTTGDFEPMVHMPLDSTGVLEAASARQLPVYFRNATSATLMSKRLGPADVARLLKDPYIYNADRWLQDLSGVRRQALRVKGRPNVRITRRINLKQLLGKPARGMLALELDAKVMRRGQLDDRAARALVRVTDLAITAKYSPHTTLVWVTSLSGGQPVGGCDVEIWRPGGTAPLWRGSTDTGGLALAPGANKLVGGKQERRFLFFVSKDDDQSYVHSTTRGGISPWDFGLEGTWEDPDGSLLGMLFTDRGIYRPGEAVRIKGLFRRIGERGLRTPTGDAVKIVVNDSRGEELRKLERKLTEFGSMDFELKLPAGAPLGSYSVVASPAGGGSVYGSFSVEEYRPAEFKVEVKPERKQYVRGDTLTWRSAGTYLFGAAMRGAKHRWYLHQSTAHYRPPEHEGYVFRDEVRWWSDRDSSSGVPLVARGSGKLDRGGAMAKSVPLKPERMTGPMTYQIETTVTDVSRQSISSRASVLLHPGEFYVGARPKETFLTAGGRLLADLVAVTPQGKRLVGKKIAGTLYRRTWHSVRKKGMNGAHYFVTRPRDTEVGDCQVVSAKKPRPCTIPVAKAGYYFLRLSARDGRKNPLSASLGLYVAGPDYVPWRRDNDDKVELVTDRKKYKVGQTARILIKSPFANAHGLFTVERSGILTRRPFKLKGTSVYMQVPITADLQPDAYVSVVLVRGRVKPARRDKDEEDPGKPTFKVGYAKLAISRDDRRLRVSVKPEREEYRPGDRAAVDLTVRDARGKPVKAELTVMVADEGVLSLIGYKTPSPMNVFYADRGLSVRTADNRLALISPKVFGEKGKGPGGGGGGRGESGPGGVRRNFVSTPFFDPQVISDDNGHARVSFKLPDNLTTFRIMVVATSAGAEFGDSQGQVRVNKPLLLLPALPRLTRVGDQLEAGVVIHNHSGKEGQVQVHASAKGVDLEGPGARTLTVPHGGSAEARFTYRAKHPGEAVLRFDAELDDHRDSLELRRPVKLPVVMEAVATHGSTTSGVAEGIVPSAAGIRDDVGGLEVAMSSSALVGLKGSVEYLLDYPYECAEQTTSRMVPLVLLRDLTEAYKLDSAPPGEIAALVDKLIARLQQLQRWNGGFAFWSSAHRTYPWVSAYATWGLAKARENGFKVSDKVMDRAKSYLEQELKHDLPADKEKVGPQQNIRAFVVFVLTELGEKPTAYVNSLYDRRADLATFGKALLLHTVTRLKPEDSDRMIETLAGELGNRVHQTGRLAKVEDNLGDGYAPLFASDVRSTAMVLDALLAARPDHPLVEKLVRYLLEVRKEGRWSTTQESAYSLLALQSYYRVREKEVPDFLARVVLGSQVVVERSFKGRSLAVQKHDVSMKKLQGLKGPLGFLKQGTGRLYYTARMRYARKELPREGWDEGFYVTRTYEPVPQDGAGSMAALRGDPNRVGKGVTRVKAGDLVRVTLRIVVPQQMHFVAVDDPLPAGLEAVNFRLVTAAQSLRRGADMFGFRPRHGHQKYSSQWYTPFYHQEIRDDRVQLFADSVPPGIHTYVYLARATTIGKFVTPPTHVEQMYEPEVFGRTGAVEFEVKD